MQIGVWVLAVASANIVPQVPPPASDNWASDINNHDWTWNSIAYTHAINDTDERLASLQSLRGTNSTIAAFADYDGDGVLDLIFIVGKGNKTELQIHCLRQNGSSNSNGFQLCLSQMLEIPSAWPNLEPYGLLPGSFTQDGSLSLVFLFQTHLKVTRRKNFSSDISSKLILALYTQEKNARFSPVWDSSTSTYNASAVPPIVVDINRDGYPDLLGHDGDTDDRIVWLNQDGHAFDAMHWDKLDEFIDLHTYSQLPKADLSVIIHSLEYITTTKFDANKTIHGDLSASGDPRKEGSSVFGFIKNVLHKIGIGSAEGDNANGGSLEEQFLKRHERDAHFGLQTSFRWAPRPLPLEHPARMAPAVGYAYLDIDGDCVADLILAVESPDFEGRYELEIWLTETTDDAKVKWRQWRGQRILLPEGTQAIALNDFSNNGGPDLVVVACDPLAPVILGNSLDAFSVPEAICDGSERIFLFKLFHPPLCVNPHLMPSLGDGICRNIDDLCSSRPFAFGGIDEGLRRIGLSISDIRLPDEMEASQVRLAASPKFPPIVRMTDVDRDGFEDLLLLVRSPKQGLGLRYLRNVLPTGEISWQHQNSLVVMKQLVMASTLWDASTTWQDNVQHLLTSFWRSTQTFLRTVFERLLGRDRHVINPLKARRFEPVETFIPGGAGSLYAGGFLEDFAHPGTLNLMTFSHSSDINESQVHLFHRGEMSLRSFSVSSVADTNFFLSATLLDPLDDTCAEKHKGQQPALGASFALAVTGLDGMKYPVRKGRSTNGGALGILKPRATYVGLGQSSNYIESLFVGAPYASRDPPRCVDPEENTTLLMTTSGHGSLLRQRLLTGIDLPADETSPLSSFYRRWVAIIPNSEITVAPGPNRSRPKKWVLSLSVNPGRQAFAIVIGTCICLGVVGSIIMVLDQREKAALSKEHQGFKRHFITV